MEAIENELINDTKESYVTTVPVDFHLYQRLKELGIIPNENDDTRTYNVGNSDYSKHLIQPWAIWQEYELDAWDADIVKRVLRKKKGEPRTSDYEKIIHDCKEKLRQLNFKLRDDK